jgi:pantetheine-phosphate adenylyltransferase
MSKVHPVTAICPGTYDPVTFGHLDVITRAAGVFERVVVGVVNEPRHKKAMFTIEERVGFLKEALSGQPNVVVDVFSELVVDFARRWGARTLVKGLRVVSDFEWEFQMNQLNRTLAPDIETVYVMASPAVSFVSSSGVKEIASFGGNVEELVPQGVARRLKEMFPNGRGGAPLPDQE